LSSAGNREKLSVMRDSSEQIYAVADEIRTRCFGQLRSLLGDRDGVWSAATAAELVTYLVEARDVGGGNFLEKLSGQLADVSSAAVELMADLAVIYELAPSSVGVPKKRAMVDGVLAIGGVQLRIPDRVLEAFTSGIANPGTWYMTRPDVQLAFLVRFVSALTGLSDEQRRRVVSDPWAFRDLLRQVPLESGYGQRAALLHLIFPDTFESIVSSRDKKRILDFYDEELPERTGDEDRDMIALRSALSERAHGRLSFYKPPWNGWRVTKETTPGWLVRGARVNGVDLVPDWIEHGYCSIAFEDIPRIANGTPLAKINEIVGEALPDLSLPQRRARAGTIDRFLNRIKPGHVIVTLRGGDVFVGKAAGPAEWTDSDGGLSNRRRPVQWLNRHQPLTRTELSQATQGKLSGQNTVSDLGLYADELLALGQASTAAADADEGEPGDVPAQVDIFALPDPTPALAKELFVPLDWLTELVDLLRERKQLVLYGPPGTGKTFLAQAVADFLVDTAGGESRVVQFHPSYAYEDFFEGFRPRPGDVQGSIVFDLVPGPLRRMAALADGDPTRPYILVIDELNRANLAKVFGELYFLLEYRRRTIGLQYSPDEDFSLPENLLIIGTMNTADRSIALIDQAMRRRFDFVGLFPGEQPVEQMLRLWLDDESMPSTAAEVLDRLNRALDDRDSAIGPSYFMNDRSRTVAGLERIWRTSITPLLEERFAGTGIDVAVTYALSRFLNSATSRQATEAMTDAAGWLTSPIGAEESADTGSGTNGVDAPFPGDGPPTEAL
jgi:5-methylcytosine-specific restriction protein B